MAPPAAGRSWESGRRRAPLTRRLRVQLYEEYDDDCAANDIEYLLDLQRERDELRPRNRASRHFGGSRHTGTPGGAIRTVSAVSRRRKDADGATLHIVTARPLRCLLGMSITQRNVRRRARLSALALFAALAVALAGGGTAWGRGGGGGGGHGGGGHFDGGGHFRGGGQHFDEHGRSHDFDHHRHFDHGFVGPFVYPYYDGYPYYYPYYSYYCDPASPYYMPAYC